MTGLMLLKIIDHAIQNAYVTTFYNNGSAAWKGNKGQQQ